MAGMNEQQTAQLRLTLHDAVVRCSERCLYQSAKWCDYMEKLDIYLSY